MRPSRCASKPGGAALTRLHKWHGTIQSCRLDELMEYGPQPLSHTNLSAYQGIQTPIQGSEKREKISFRLIRWVESFFTQPPSP